MGLYQSSITKKWQLVNQMPRTMLSPQRLTEIKKGHQGIIREIILNGDVEKAIKNAKKLEDKYLLNSKTIFSTISDMNPYTSVFKLIEQFMVEIS